MPNPSSIKQDKNENKEFYVWNSRIYRTRQSLSIPH